MLFVAPLALLDAGRRWRSGCPCRASTVAAAFTLLVVQKSFIGAVVNNDSLMILLAAVSVVAALRYLVGGTRATRGSPAPRPSPRPHEVDGSARDGVGRDRDRLRSVRAMAPR